MSENTTTDQVDDTTPDEAEVGELEGLTARAAALDAEKREADAKTDAELVAQRTADNHETKAAAKTSDAEHVKVFVIPGDEPKPTASNYDHEPNIAATRQYMMSQGLRPVGDVVFKGAEPFGPGGKSWALTYAVNAVPAERFDFQPVGVLDQQDDADQVNDGAGNADADKLPAKPTHADLDAYASAHDIDLGEAKTIAEKLAVINKPTA